MWRFIVISFAFLAFAFWELSGGADYAPRENSLQARSAQTPAVESTVLASDTTATPAPAPAESATQTAARTGLADLKDSKGERFEITLASVDTSPKSGTAATTARSEKVADKVRILTQPQSSEDTAVLAALDEAQKVEDEVERVWPGAIELFEQQSQQASLRREAEEAARAAMDIRYITASAANMRGGPGTDYTKVGRLTEGSEVAVLSAPGNGWLELQVVATGETGWMADWLVSAPAQ